MPFSMDHDVGAAMAAMIGDNPPPPLPAGDVKGRRELLDMMFNALGHLRPVVNDVSYKDFQTKADDGHPITCRWFTKNDSKPTGSAVVYAHGGGMIALSIDQYNDFVKNYVSRTGVPFLMVDYRLCPEVKAPVPVTDTYAGLMYLFDHAEELGVDPKRVAIMGDSGGGGVMASLAHYIKSKGGPEIVKQILIYPMLDDYNTKPNEDLAPFATWSIDDNKTAWGSVLGDKLAAEGVSAIEAGGRATVEDCKALPPAYIDVGELDLFREENLKYAQTLGRAGVSCETHVFPGVPHAFDAFAPEAKISKAAMELRFRAVSSF